MKPVGGGGGNVSEGSPVPANVIEFLSEMHYKAAK